MMRSLGVLTALLLVGGALAHGAGEPTVAQRRQAYRDTLSVCQIGYRPEDRKVAVVSLGEPLQEPGFVVRDASGQAVFTGRAAEWTWPEGVRPWWDRHYYRLDFSGLTERGLYHVECGGLHSPPFPVRNSIYREVLSRDGVVTPGVLLTGFLAAQRCHDEKCMSAPGTSHPLGPPARPGSDTAVPAHRAVRADAVSEPVPGHPLVDVEGGWHDASSKDKETVREALQVLQLARAYERAPGLCGAGLAAELRWGLDYLAKLQDADGGFYLAVQGQPPGSERRVLTDKSVGTNMRCAAAFAAACRVLRGEDADYASACLERARRAFRWVEENPEEWVPSGAYMGWFLDREAWVAEGGLELYLALRDVPGAEGEARRALAMALGHVGAGQFVYGDGHWAIWAKKTGEFVRQAPWTMEAVAADEIVPSMVGLHPHAGPDLQEKIRSDLSGWRDFMLGRLGRNPYNVYQDLLVGYWGQNGAVLRAGHVLLELGEFLGDERCVEAATDQFRWVAGNNPFGLSYIVGFGTDYEDDLYVRPAVASLGGVVPGVLAFDGIPMARCARMPEPWKTQELGIADGLVPILSILDSRDGGADEPAPGPPAPPRLALRQIVMDGLGSRLQPVQAGDLAFIARPDGYTLPRREGDATSAMDFAGLLAELGGDERLPEFGELRAEFARPLTTVHGWNRPAVWTVHLSNGWLMFVFHDAETLALDIRALDWSTHFHYTSTHAVAEVQGLGLAFDTDGFAVWALMDGEWRAVERRDWLSIPWAEGEGHRPPYGYFPTYPSFRARAKLHNWSYEEDLEIARIVWDARLPERRAAGRAP
jgi:hypothetical protein